MKRKPRIFQIAATPREMVIKLDLSGRTYNPVDQSLVDGVAPILLSMLDPTAAAPQAVRNNLYRARDELRDEPEPEDRTEDWRSGWNAGKKHALEVFFETLGLALEEDDSSLARGRKA